MLFFSIFLNLYSSVYNKAYDTEHLFNYKKIIFSDYELNNNLKIYQKKLKKQYIQKIIDFL